MAKTKKRSLTYRIVVGMFLGFLTGAAFNFLGEQNGEAKALIETWFTGGIFMIVGKAFVASLKVMVVPLVFVSLTCGAAALDDISKFGRVGGKTMGLYLITTAFAITMALSLALLLKPGEGINFPTDMTFVAKEAPPLTQVILDIFPTNPFKAMAEGKMLQIIVFAILFGVTLTLSGAPGQRVLSVFKDLNDVIMKMVMIIIEFAPYGVYCLLANAIASQGADLLLNLMAYFVVVVLALTLHAFGTYGMILKFVGGLNPIHFYKKFKSVMLFAFNTASSGATIPVTLEKVEDDLGVDPKIAAFTIPLGATVNMDGTAIMQGVATAFIAQAYGMDIGASGYAMVIVTATLASIGTAAVPSAGLVMLAMVLNQVNLPTEAIGYILGVDRLLDMARTAVNVAGDASVTCVVAKSEKALNMKTFNKASQTIA